MKTSTQDQRQPKNERSDSDIKNWPYHLEQRGINTENPQILEETPSREKVSKKWQSQEELMWRTLERI